MRICEIERDTKVCGIHNSKHARPPTHIRPVVARVILLVFERIEWALIPVLHGSRLRDRITILQGGSTLKPHFMENAILIYVKGTLTALQLEPQEGCNARNTATHPSLRAKGRTKPPRQQSTCRQTPFLSASLPISSMGSMVPWG